MPVVSPGQSKIKQQLDLAHLAQYVLSHPSKQFVVSQRLAFTSRVAVEHCRCPWKRYRMVCIYLTENGEQSVQVSLDKLKEMLDLI